MKFAAKAYFFDMDHTLIDNDCDVSWKMFMQRLGMAPANALQTADDYYRDYLAGTLRADEFMAWQLLEIKGMSLDDARRLAIEHFHEFVESRIYAQARTLIESVQRCGLPTAIVTSTNDLVAGPVAECLGIDSLLATELEICDDRVTGGFVPPYMTAEAKVVKARAQCAALGLELVEIAYYGDSIADIPLLEEVGFPNVVNPKPELRRRAEDAGWPIHAFV